jgi:hypothetical protein
MSLKDSLSHNGNKYHLIPARTFQSHEKSYNMPLLVTYIKYNKYSWHSSGDLTVTADLLG